MIYKKKIPERHETLEKLMKKYCMLCPVINIDRTEKGYEN